MGRVQRLIDIECDILFIVGESEETSSVDEKNGHVIDKRKENDRLEPSRSLR